MTGNRVELITQQILLCLVVFVVMATVTVTGYIPLFLPKMHISLLNSLVS